MTMLLLSKGLFYDKIDIRKYMEVENWNRQTEGMKKIYDVFVAFG